MCAVRASSHNFSVRSAHAEKKKTLTIMLMQQAANALHQLELHRLWINLTTVINIDEDGCGGLAISNLANVRTKVSNIDTGVS